MIQLMVECGGGAPIAFQHDEVTGVRVQFCGRTFQVLEGPEAAVMLAVAVLADHADHLARTAIAMRSFATWKQETLSMDGLPFSVARRLREFADATQDDAQPDAMRAITFLQGLADPHHVPAITSGRRPMPKVGGQSGNRAWVVV